MVIIVSSLLNCIIFYLWNNCVHVNTEEYFDVIRTHIQIGRYSNVGYVRLQLILYNVDI